MRKFYNGICARCGICKFNRYDSYAGFIASEHVVLAAANYSRRLEIRLHKISKVVPRFLRPISHRHQQKIFCKMFILLPIFLKLILDKQLFRHTKFSTTKMTSMKFVCFLLGNYPASGVYMPTFRNTLSHLRRQVDVSRMN